MSILSASILSCDPANIGRDIKQAVDAGVKSIHVDIMDGYYVSNMTFGPNLIHRLSEISNVPICVHLEVQNPDVIAQLFFETPCSSIVFQLDTCGNPIHLLKEIRASGKHAGVGVGPAYGIDNIKYIKNYIDELIVMGVEPGYSGQPFEPSAYEKLKKTNLLLRSEKMNNNILVCVDGGVTSVNSRKLMAAGTDVLICGSSIFNGNIQANVDNLLSSLK